MLSCRHVSVLSADAENYSLPVTVFSRTSAGMHGHFQLSRSPIVQIVSSSSMKVAVMNLKQPKNNFHNAGSDLNQVVEITTLRSTGSNRCFTDAARRCFVKSGFWPDFSGVVLTKMKKWFRFGCCIRKLGTWKQSFISYHFGLWGTRNDFLTWR